MRHVYRQKCVSAKCLQFVITKEKKCDYNFMIQFRAFVSHIRLLNLTFTHKTNKRRDNNKSTARTQCNRFKSHFFTIHKVIASNFHSKNASYTGLPHSMPFNMIFVWMNMKALNFSWHFAFMSVLLRFIRNVKFYIPWCRVRWALFGYAWRPNLLMHAYGQITRFSEVIWSHTHT